MQPTPRQLPAGTQVKTLQQQEQERLAQEAAYQAYMQQQAAAQQAPAQAPQPAAPGAFPGSAPGAPSDGLLGSTMKAIGDFFTPDKKLGEMVPASQNPLMSAPGVGIGGEMRRRQIEAQVNEAEQGQAQRRR